MKAYHETNDSGQMARLFAARFKKRKSLRKIWWKVHTSAAAACALLTLSIPCEKPTPTGWSMKSRLEFVFHEKG
jgi:hypothetical protein